MSDTSLTLDPRNFTEIKVDALTPDQKEAMTIARIGLSTACPFLAHYMYAEMKEFFTTDVKMLGTDGRRVYINPEYMASLKPSERVFALAHEVDHQICRDPQRVASYSRSNEVTFGGQTTAFDADQMNQTMDYVRNANLLETGIGTCNPDWLYRDDVAGDEIPEQTYHRIYIEKPPSDGNGGGGNQGQSFGDSNRGRGTRNNNPGDDSANENGGGFDQVFPPQTDAATGKEDVPDEMAFKEAVARAASAAKQMGKLPAQYEKMVEELLAPQVSWADHIRMVLTGKIGNRFETWTRPNRRRLVLNPMVIMPSKRGYGADLVVIAVDTSGSIYAAPKVLETFFSEVGGVLTDVKPKTVMLIECDAAVQRVTEANSLDELEVSPARRKVRGGGGTRFEPVFEYLAENNIKPDTLVYLTDMYGSFPSEEPSYPVVWASITNLPAPFGELVEVKVDE